jgi:hypothetical protein
VSKLLFKNNKILFSGGSGGFSQDCRCCARTTPCYECCRAEIEYGDALSFSLIGILPSFTVGGVFIGFNLIRDRMTGRVFTGQRTIPGTTMTGDGVCFAYPGVDSGTGGGSCVYWDNETSATFSPYTFVNESRNIYSNGLGERYLFNIIYDHPSLPEQCSCRFLAFFNVYIYDVLPDAGIGPVVMPLETSPRPGLGRVGYIVDSGIVPLSGDSVCGGGVLNLPLTVTNYDFPRLDAASVVSPTSFGSVTITGIE